MTVFIGKSFRIKMLELRVYACSVLTQVAGLWTGQHCAHPSASLVSSVLTRIMEKRGGYRSPITCLQLTGHLYFPTEAPIFRLHLLLYKLGSRSFTNLTNLKIFFSF